MSKNNSNNSIPIKSYVEKLEPGAQQQAEMCARLPNAFHHIALMPDAHQGYAMPVGGVMALKNAVMPNAVGVDIGCGMIAARTTLREKDIQRDLEKLAQEILGTIPVGFNKHKKPQEADVINRVMVTGKEMKQLKKKMPIVAKHLNEIPYQLGTLGGGNHFIEIQKDQEGFIWFMLHSGSRNIGLKIASAYHALAKDYCSYKGFGLPKDYSFLTLDLIEAQQYLREMSWAMDFALENRLQMINEVIDLASAIFSKHFTITEDVRTHHNYAAWEKHFDEQVLVHRKGAVRATEGELVTIPGSMGTSSYIARGKGYADSFHSCSHGAGRNKSRTQAKSQISRNDFEKQMDGIILVTPKRNKIIDEAPSAYKNIDDVMSLQREMVDVVYRLQPLAVVKG